MRQICYYLAMFEKDLRVLKKQELLRRILTRKSAAGPVITMQGKRCVNYASNDYLGLANHPDVVNAARKALDGFGFGSGASRLLAGGTVLHDRLEKLIAGFKHAEAARVFNSGYAANTGIIPILASEHDIIFSDALNHASIIDGCRLSSAQTVIYRHKDMSHLAGLLKKAKSRKKIIVTDTVFSMDGDIAPLQDVCILSRKHGALLYLDDAHGTGVLGKGRGALAHFAINAEPWIVQMGTFSKACGSFGAFVAGAEDIIQWISNTARSLLYSTALPPVCAAASIAALQLIRNDRTLIRQLWQNRGQILDGLAGLGYDCMETETPIIPVRTSSVHDAVLLSAFLLEGGVYAPAIRPPTVKEPRIRITVTAAHEEMHISRLLDRMKKWRKKKKQS